MFLYFKQEMVVSGGYVRAIDRVWDNIVSKLVDEIGYNMGGIRTSVLLMQMHFFRQHISFCFEARGKASVTFDIEVGIDCWFSRQELLKK